MYSIRLWCLIIAACGPVALIDAALRTCGSGPVLAATPDGGLSDPLWLRLLDLLVRLLAVIIAWGTKPRDPDARDETFP